MNLSQIELVWVRVRVGIHLGKCFRVSSERRKQGVCIQDGSGWMQIGRIQDGCHHQVESEWMSEVFFCAKWLNPRWQKSRWKNSRWLPSSSWVRMNEWSFFVQMLGTNLGRCEWVWEEKLGWLSLSQIELVWVRLRVEWECFWVNLREENKLSLYKMAVSETNMTEFKMPAIIKLSKNEWIWVRLN